jgi:CheY-like chemotaxis protein
VPTPRAPVPPQAPAARVPAEPVPTPGRVPTEKRSSPASDPRAEIDPAKLVLVADPDAASCKATVRALESWGLHAATAPDGVEAILAIQRRLPQTVVLDAALPKMFGFQVCELVKRNESLRRIHVVLIGAIHDQDRHRRSPTDLYGADAYLEKPDLPEGLVPILRGFGLPVSDPGAADSAAAPAQASAPESGRAPAAPQPVAPAPAPRQQAPAEATAPPAGPPASPAAPVAPAGAASSETDDPMLMKARAEAERLARIIVSDLVLYNEDKFMRAVVSGSVVEAMDGDLDEGRSLFRQRIDPRVQAERDYLNDELLRVARVRGMR